MKSSRPALGVGLIVIGMLCAASSAAVVAQDKGKGASGAALTAQAIGGALCSLTFGIPGIYLALSRSSSKRGRTGRSAGQWPVSPRTGDGSDSAEVDPPKPAKLPVGADGKLSLTCLACFAEVRVEVPAGASIVTCPKCEREIPVSPNPKA